MSSEIQFLTAEELGKFLRIPKRTIYKFAQDGLIPGTIRIGKHWRFQKGVVEEWIQNRSLPGKFPASRPQQETEKIL